MNERESVNEREKKAEGSAFDSLMEPEDRIRGLAHCDVMLERLAAARGSRRLSLPGRPRNAIERHIDETGHALAQACCAQEAA